MHHHRVSHPARTVGLVGLAVLATALGSAPPVSAMSNYNGLVNAPRCASAVPGDINGDGFAEVAVGEPGNDRGRGSVHVFYGSRNGLVVDAAGTARNDQYLSQDTSGVPGKAEAGDAFGSTTLLADLNGDRCADLAVGSPGENGRTGWVQVFFGSPTGLRTSGVQSFSLSELPGAPKSATGQELGDTIAAGDLDGDGIADLIAGVPALRVNGLAAAGGVAVVYGGSSGLQLKRSSVLTRDTAGIPGAAEAYGGFGTAVAAGDFDGNGATELAASSTHGTSRGSVHVVRRTATGFEGGAPIGVAAAAPGQADRFCEFGSVLASGDVHGDGRDDLAVADPSFGCHDEETEFGMGAVVLLRGSSSGLTATGSQLWTQGSPGVQGTPRMGNVFGESLAMAPLDRGVTDDLVIGAPGDVRGGSVTLLLGSPTGLTTAGAGGSRYTQSTTGIPGTDEYGDEFGDTVSTPLLQSRNQANLVVGTPGEDVGKIKDAGAISQLRLGSTGPDPSGSRTINAATAGVQGTARANERFGGGVRRWG